MLPRHTVLTDPCIMAVTYGLIVHAGNELQFNNPDTTHQNNPTNRLIEERLNHGNFS